MSAAVPVSGRALGFWVMPGLLLVLLVLAYSETARSFFATWSGRDDYSHGFLVPLVSLYLVWTRREQLRATAVRPDYAVGIPLLALGCAMLVAGRIGAVVAAEQASVLLVAPGLVLILWGRAVFREVLSPLAYLALMVPAVIDPLIAKLHWPLQLFGASCASSLLGVAGIPVVRERQFLTLPNVTLEVANVCSGVRYLISVVALSLPLAHLMLRRTRQRVLLVLAALLIGITANPLRIALIGVWVYHRGPEQIHGPGHVLNGFFVSLVGIGFLFAAATAISWWGRGRGTPGSAGRDAVRQSPAGDGPRSAAPWLLAVLLFGLTAGTAQLYRPQPVSLGASLQTLPVSVGGLRVQTVAVPESPLRLDAPDAELERLYTGANGAEVRLYVGYLGAQSQGRELVYYTFQHIYDRSTTERLAGDGSRMFEASEAVVHRGGRWQVIYYWYVIGGKTVAGPLQAKVRTALAGLTTRKTHGAIVAVSREVQAERDVPAAIEEVRAFALAESPVLEAMLSGGEVSARGGTP